MSHSARTGNGWWSDRTDVAGGRSEWRLNGALTAMATGDGATPAGIGPAMSHGGGPPTTTAAGIGAWNLAGFGCRTRNGRLPGFRGGTEPDMWVGPLCPRRRGLGHAVLSRFASRRSRRAHLYS